MVLTVLQKLAETEWSVALHESLWVWPLLESSHVLTLALFAGSTMLFDLRLTGWALSSVPASTVLARLLPWTRLGFAIMLATGLLLFYATPVRNYQNIFFRTKMALMLLAGLNVWLFHRGIYRRVHEWGDAALPPRAARLAGYASLVFWAGVIISGRLVAYNWFDCDIQPQPDFINWAAGCVVP
ncbi:MAG TPA: DUF6644 family protein [Vicinamibacterales bacterium]|nr:DUF6644 family protein [Vicinamibacterales bacterium]